MRSPRLFSVPALPPRLGGSVILPRTHSCDDTALSPLRVAVALKLGLKTLHVLMQSLSFHGGNHTNEVIIT